MALFKVIAVALALIVAGVSARTGYGPGDQEYGHITVRTGAHMFYWLFYTQAAGINAPTDRPVVIWLQGGPGASSAGYGNFAELGPLYINGSARASSWVNYVNLLFIDNPVGTGFSYVDNILQLTSNNEQIGTDMIVFLTNFYNTYPALKSSPLYIFCESYGGKMVVEIAKQLNAAIKAGSIDVDFRGVGLGDSWISPIDSVNTWAPFLLYTGVVDQAGSDIIAQGAQTVQNRLDNGQYLQATNAWGALESTVLDQSYGVDFYNILYKTSATRLKALRAAKTPLELLYISHVVKDDQDDINVLMDGPVRQALGIDRSIGFGTQGNAVFQALSVDFMKPVTSVVEELLNNTDLNVVVFTGQLDLIVDTPGTVQWVDRLKWPGATQWRSATRQPLSVNGYLEGYVKTVNNLSLYWINRSGHMVPTDNPDTAIELLRRVTKFDS